MKIRILVLITLIAFHARADEVQSAHDFLFSDFGAINTHSLQTHTLPKRVAITALVLEGRKQGWIAPESTDYRSVLSKFGFITPEKIANAPAGLRDTYESLPMGLTEKEIRLGLPVIQVLGMNVSCASCHAGRLHDAAGKPTQSVWMGLPNTSINMDLYTRSVYDGFKLVNQDVKSAHKLMKTIFPDADPLELTTLKLFVYRTVKKRIGRLEKTVDQPLPFSSGSPGATNGVAALKYTLKMMDREHIQPEYGFTSIPSLGDRFLRTSWLYDGVYSAPNAPRFAERSSWTVEDEKAFGAAIAAFTIPTMGQSIEGSLKGVEHIQNVLHDVVSNYKAPLFPGEVDIAAAVRGSRTFSQNCAQCHGSYEWRGNRPQIVSYPNKLIPQERIQTDPWRAQVVTQEFVDALNATDLSKILVAGRTGGYVAPLLNSLWATAPYLHNGSVPTLYHLMHPSERPTKFLVGGHDLDYKKMGLKLTYDRSTETWVYPKDVQPWSLPVMYDTTKPGQSNQGHTRQFENLSENEKSDLIEYLKLL